MTLTHPLAKIGASSGFENINVGIFWSKESIKHQSFLGRKPIMKQDACLVYFLSYASGL